MSIFTKKLDSLTKEDLDLLVTESERESIHLDYKKAINPSTDGKHDLIKHIVGMANTEGGFIIFGIEEDTENGIPTDLEGIDPSIGNQKADEWIENVVNPHISPRVIIKLKTIQISEKIAIIVWIPLSSRRPHMSTYESDNRIYRRYNTQTLPASEAEIREMYQRSDRIETQREDFIKQRNLFDVTSNNFGQNTNSLELIPKREGIDEANIPIVLLSSCPRFLEERVDISSDEINNWLKDNYTVEIANKTVRAFIPRDFQLDSNSISCIIPHGSRQYNLEYLEIQRNGFVEHGMGIRLIRSISSSKLFLNLGRTTLACWAFLKFIQKFYQRIDYLDEFTIYLSIRNVNQLDLNGFLGLGENGHPWAAVQESLDDYISTIPQFSVQTYATVIPTKPRTTNFQYQRLVSMNELDDEQIFEIAKNFSTRISNNFGLQKAHCYNIDGSFAEIHFDSYNRLLG